MLLALLLACPDPECDPLFDRDNDGSNDCEDCDDEDPKRSKLLEETCDGIDEDCSTVVDDDPVDGPYEGWFDLDGDGVGGAYMRSCTPIESEAAIGGDCDDDDPERTHCVPSVQIPPEISWNTGFEKGPDPKWFISAQLAAGALVVTGDHSSTALVTEDGAQQVLDARLGQTALADLDADGLAEVHWLDGDVRRVLALPDFEEHQALTTDAVWVLGADIDGDGVLDLVASDATGLLSISTSAGEGHTLQLVDPSTEPMRAGDIDGDGVEDWISSAEYTSEGDKQPAVQFGGTGASAFVPPSFTIQAWAGVGDLDGDGDDDIAVAGPSTLDWDEEIKSFRATCLFSFAAWDGTVVLASGPIVSGAAVVLPGTAPNDACLVAPARVAERDAALFAGAWESPVVRLVGTDLTVEAEFDVDAVDSDAIYPGAAWLDGQYASILGDPVNDEIVLASLGTWEFEPDRPSEGGPSGAGVAGGCGGCTSSGGGAMSAPLAAMLVGGALGRRSPRGPRRNHPQVPTGEG